MDNNDQKFSDSLLNLKQAYHDDNRSFFAQSLAVLLDKVDECLDPTLMDDLKRCLEDLIRDITLHPLAQTDRYLLLLFDSAMPSDILLSKQTDPAVPGVTIALVQSIFRCTKNPEIWLVLQRHLNNLAESARYSDVVGEVQDQLLDDYRGNSNVALRRVAIEPGEQSMIYAFGVFVYVYADHFGDADVFPMEKVPYKTWLGMQQDTLEKLDSSKAFFTALENLNIRVIKHFYPIDREGGGSQLIESVSLEIIDHGESEFTLHLFAQQDEEGNVVHYDLGLPAFFSYLFPDEMLRKDVGDLDAFDLDGLKDALEGLGSLAFFRSVRDRQLSGSSSERHERSDSGFSSGGESIFRDKEKKLSFGLK